MSLKIRFIFFRMKVVNKTTSNLSWSVCLDSRTGNSFLQTFSAQILTENGLCLKLEILNV